MVNSDNLDWESLEGPENFKDQQIQSPEKQINLSESENKKQDWGDLLSPETYQGEYDPTQDEDTLGYIARNLTANASRVLETVGGRLGDMEKFSKDVLVNFPKASGIIPWAISELVGPENWERIVRGDDPDETRFPTSENLKKLSSAVSGGYTDPKTKGEKRFQNVVQDIASTITGRTPTLRNIAINNLGVPLASNSVKEMVSGLGFGEDKANISKVLTWLGLSLFGNINGEQYASRLMNEARQIPPDINFNTNNVLNRLDQVSRSPRLLFSDPRSQLARDQLQSVRRDIANGQTSFRSLLTMYDGNNAAKRSAGLFGMNPEDQRFARSAIDQVQHVLRDEVFSFRDRFPNQIQSWDNGRRAWAVIHESNYIKNRVEQLLKGPYNKSIPTSASILFGLGNIAKNPQAGLPLAAAAQGVHKGIQLGYRVIQDPNLARYYFQSIADLSRDNIPAFIKNYNKLNEKLKKEEKSKSVYKKGIYKK